MGVRFDLFPVGSLDASVITTVWVGVWAVAFLNLRLGWSFSGLVVPGYLVPLLLVKPWSAASICVEGVATYLIVRWLSEWLPLRGWSDLFGRDRYFALLIVSVPVRLAFDGWLLPAAGGEWVNARYGLAFDYHNNLPGFGLVIIPLVANQFWKTGLLRGVLPLAVPVAFAYAVTRYVLTEYTNFSIGNLQYVYGELAADLLASPKTYIIVLTTAYLASRMNQRYAWEYHGILLPALLAAEWYEPTKVAVTFAEAAIIYVLASVLLEAPLVRRMSFEGARKVLFFFTIGFAYKLLLGHLLVKYAAGEKATDYFAYGYMISTLMALKSHDKGIPLRLGRAVIQVSLTGAVIGSLIGFALTFVPKGLWPGSETPATGPPGTTGDPPSGRLLDILRDDRPGLYGPAQPGSEVVPDATERQAFAQALAELVAYSADRDSARLTQARRQLAEVGYELHELRGGYLYLRERSPARGWGIYVFNPAQRDGSVFEVPAPLTEWATMEVGAVLFERWQGRALAIAGRGRTRRKGGSDDDARSFFHVHRSVVGRQNAVRLRGYADEGPDRAEPPTALRVWSDLPPGLRLADLRTMIGPFDITWEPTPGADKAFAELTVSRDARRALLARSITGVSDHAATLLTMEGNIRDWLFARRADIAGPGTDLYKPATVSEMLYFDDEVVTPVLRAVRSRGDAPNWSDADRDRLRAAARAAAACRYMLILYRDSGTGADFVVLAEADTPRRRYWGTYVFRTCKAGAYLVQVPRPLAEQNSYEFGVTLFDRQQAAVFAVVGTHPDANRNHSADLFRAQSRVNLFNLVSQVVLRQGGTDPMMVVQSRAFGVSPTGTTPTADVVFATDNGATGPAALSPLADGLFRGLSRERLSVQFADGSLETSGYGAAGSAQTGYLVQTTNKELALVWVTPAARSNYRQQADNELQRAHFSALEIPTVERGLFDHLVGLEVRAAAASLQADVRELIERYAATQDVVALHTAVSRGRDRGFRFERLIDPDTQRSFLLIHDRDALPLVANIGVRPALPAGVMREPLLDRERVGEFIRTRAVWLEIGGER